MMNMHRDFAALRARLAGSAARYEKREAPDMAAIKETIDKIGVAFEEFKKTNDERLAEIKAGGEKPETVAKLKKIDAEIGQLEDVKKRLEAVETRVARPGAGAVGKANPETPQQAEHRAAFLNWMRAPKDGDRQRDLRTAEKTIEIRATDTLTGAAGGFAVPEMIAREILRLGVDMTPMRQLARVVTSGTPDYKELVDVGGATFNWVGETGAVAETSTPQLAEVAPTFGKAAAYPKATEESLNDMFFNVEQWLIDSAAEAIAKGEETAFVSGNGTNKPTGFLAGTPVATGDASRAFGVLEYVASGVAAGMPASADTFINLVHKARARYRGNARWLVNKATLATLRQYKDTTNQYLWQPGLIAGAPSMFLGYQVAESEDMPDVAANAFAVAFGDFREGYLIVDLVGMGITRDEITTPGYVKFYVRKRVGGKIKNSQAIKLLKCSLT